MPSGDQTERKTGDLHLDKKTPGSEVQASAPDDMRTESSGVPKAAEGPGAIDGTLARTVTQQEGDVARSKALSTPSLAISDQSRTQKVSKGQLGTGDEDLRTELQSSSARRIAERISKGVVPGYQIMEKLGEGTYGVVYRAREENTGIEVAIKFFEKVRSQHWQLIQAEVEQLARLQSEGGIVQLRKVDSAASPPYYVMALAEKGCLAKMLRDRKKIPLAEALPLFRQVVETLAYVHAKGIRHCDLKPGNILIDAGGRARVGDFGQAHLSSDDSPTLGTFFYMAPEQADLKKQIPDSRWDVYGLGALFYAMLTGAPPRQNPEVRDLLSNTADLSHRLDRYRQWVEKSPPPREHYRVSGMYRQLARLVDSCLDPQPEERPRDAAALLYALDQGQHFKRQKPLLLFALVAPIFLLIFLTGLGLLMANRTLHSYLQSREKGVGESDLALARLAAFKIESQLQDRVLLLEKEAQDQTLRQLVKARQQGKLASLLQNRLAAAGQTYEKYFLSGMWVLDEQGTMLAIAPHDQSVVDINYSWRDYFNGQADYPEARSNPGKRYPPLRRSYLSQPFVGTAKEIGLVLAVSTPVLDADGSGNIIGVLSASIKIESLADWLWELNKIHDVYAVLINNRKNVLFHEQKSRILPAQFQKPKEWGEPGDVFDKVLHGRSGHEVYVDPVDQQRYVGGFASFRPVPSSPEVLGGILVQHKYSWVMAPVEDLGHQMMFWGIVMLSTASGLLLLMWLGLWRALRRQEGLGHA